MSFYDFGSNDDPAPLFNEEERRLLNMVDNRGESPREQIWRAELVEKIVNCSTDVPETVTALFELKVITENDARRIILTRKMVDH